MMFSSSIPPSPTPQFTTLSLHDALPISVKDCVTIDVLPRTPGNNVYVGFMVWSNFTATKCRGLVRPNHETNINIIAQIGRADQQECRDRTRMPSSACKKKKHQHGQQPP